MTQLKIAAAAAAFALAAGAAGAAELTIDNLTSTDIVSISADPGEIEGFKRIPSGTKRSFGIAMPEGECETSLVLRFDDGTTSEGAADVCNGGSVRITDILQ